MHQGHDYLNDTMHLFDTFSNNFRLAFHGCRLMRVACASARGHSMEADREKHIRDLERIAKEQTALRRVTTLVAHRAPPTVVFDAITEELGRLLEVECSALNRYELNEEGKTVIRVLAAWSADDLDLAPAVGSRWDIPDSVSELVLKSGRSARANFDHDTSGIIGFARAQNIRAGVGCPIIVAGRLWGLSVVLSLSAAPLPSDIETRMAKFVELAAVTIETAENREEVMASRSRIVEAADVARRRIERDLHDGAQQRLISLGVDLRLAEAAVPSEFKELKEQIAHIAQSATKIHEEVREIARGVYPAILSSGGLKAALKTLATRSSIPVKITAHDNCRLAERIEITAYYIASEALTNAARHSNASEVCIDLAIRDSRLCLAIRDDGIGGAEPARGSGLTGLTDRVDAIGGSLEIISPAGKGTSLIVKIPIELPRRGRHREREAAERV